MQPFHYVVILTRSCGLLTGQGAKARFEHPFAVGRLQDTIITGDVRWEKNNKRFILFISFDTC